MSDIPMSEMESQLRIFMNIAVAEPPGRMNAVAVRRRAIRRRAATLLTGVTAAVLVLGIGVAVAVATTGSARVPASHVGLPAGMPRFYIEQSQDQSGFPTKTMVRVTASGAVTGTVACPWHRAHVVITSIVPADDQEFFMVCERFLGRISYSAVAGSRIYRFRLTSAGRADGYSLVQGGVLNGLRVGDIAVTPDGSEVAVDLYTTSGAQVPDIIVIDTRTGAHAVWHVAPLVPGKIIYPILDLGLSFTANGQELAFLTRPHCVKGKNASPCHVYGEEMRAVSHPASGGKLSNSRLLLQFFPWPITDAVISPDGRTVVLAEMRVSLGYLSIARVSVATGKQVDVLFRERTGASFNLVVFSSDPSCRFFILITGPSTRRLVNGGIGNGRLFRLKPSGRDVHLEAW